MLKHHPSQATEEHGLMSVRSYLTFLKMRSQVSIHHYKGDWRWAFKCKNCMYHKEPHLLQQKIDDTWGEIEQLQGEVTNLEKTLSKKEVSAHPTRQLLTNAKTKHTKLVKRQQHIPRHQELIKHQRAYDHKIKAEAPVGTLIVRIDFVGFEFQDDKCVKLYVNNLVVILENLVITDGQREWVREYFDFLCSDKATGKNDYHYVHGVFEWLKQFQFFVSTKQMVIVSDNAGKHFKNKATFEYIEQNAVELQVLIYWLMYAPHHGWSLCDGREGLLSQKVNKMALDGNKPDTAVKMQELIDKSNLTNAYPVVLLVCCLLVIS